MKAALFDFAAFTVLGLELLAGCSPDIEQSPGLMSYKPVSDIHGSY